MKLSQLLVAGTVATSLFSSALIADTAPAASNISDSQKKDIEKVVHDYLVANPEVLLEASQALQQKQQQNMQQQAQAAISENAANIFDTNTLTVIGNPKGSVSVVEFFDYQCIHCKKMSPIVDSLIKNDSDLRVVFKEFPIFGNSSEHAAKAALAAGMQGKYRQMHDALMKVEKRLDDKIIMDTAKSIGLDLKKLAKDMNSKQVTDILAANRQLAEKLHLMGTPAFIVGSTPSGQFKTGTEPSFVPGAASEQSLQELIKKAAGN